MTRLALIVLVVAAAATHVFADAPSSASRSALPTTPGVVPTRGAGPPPAPLPARVPVPSPPSGRAPGNPCLASWYGDAHAGRITASGEPFDPARLAAAHPTVAFGTWLEVTAESRTVTVEVTDRGPAAWTGRCIDLSEAAFAELAPLGQGLVEVLIEEAT